MLKIDYESNLACLDAADPEAEAAMDAKYVRRGGLCWSLTPGDVRQTFGPPPEPASLVVRAASLVRALASGPTPQGALARRRLSCFGDPPSAVPPCAALVVDERGAHCRECGCPRWWLSDLERKLRMAGTSCPRRRPGFPNSTL